MEFSIDMASLEKLNRLITENVDPKYTGLIDPNGIDSLKKAIAEKPELKKFFKVEHSEEER